MAGDEHKLSLDKRLLALVQSRPCVLWMNEDPVNEQLITEQTGTRLTTLPNKTEAQTFGPENKPRKNTPRGFSLLINLK